MINDASSGAKFKVDSSCYNAEANTLTDKVSGLTATLTGTPTVTDNNIMFTSNDYFVFDISSLDLTNSDITVRVKFTQPSLTSSAKNVLTVGSSNLKACWGIQILFILLVILIDSNMVL